MELSARQMEVLNELVGAERSHAKRGKDPDKMRITPLDLGGTNGSHHSATLRSLVKKALVWRHKYGCYCRHEGSLECGCKGSCSYHTTSAGKEVIENYWRAKRAGGLLNGKQT